MHSPGLSTFFILCESDSLQLPFLAIFLIVWNSCTTSVERLSLFTAAADSDE